MTFIDQFEQNAVAIESAAATAYVNDMMAFFVATEADDGAEGGKKSSIGAWISKTYHTVIAALMNFGRWIREKVTTALSTIGTKVSGLVQKIRSKKDGSGVKMSRKQQAKIDKQMKTIDKIMEVITSTNANTKKLMNLLQKAEAGVEKGVVNDDITAQMDSIKKYIQENQDLYAALQKGADTATGMESFGFAMEADVDDEPVEDVAPNRVSAWLSKIGTTIKAASNASNEAYRNTMQAKAEAEKASRKDSNGKLAKLWSHVPRFFSMIGRWFSSVLSAVRSFFGAIFGKGHA